jgi:hypothetical protein
MVPSTKAVDEPIVRKRVSPVNQKLSQMWLVLLISLFGMRVNAMERVALLPVTCFGADEAICQQLTQKLYKFIPVRLSVELVEREKTDQAILHQCGTMTRWWQCFDLDQNLLAIGDQLQVKAVIVGKLAMVGKTQRMQLKLTDENSRTISSAVVEMHQADEGPVLLQLSLLLQRVLGSPKSETPEPAKPWYQHWEVWTIAGAVVALAAGGVVLGMMISDKGVNDWDRRLLLP